MRILITGSREWSDGETIRKEILDALPGIPTYSGSHTIVHGGARGADRIAAQLAVGLAMKVEEYPAHWDLHGRRAGAIRNQQMVYRGADICLAFPLPGSVGTWDCVKRANAAGIRVEIAGHKGGVL